MTYLLDTNAITEILKRTPDQKVVAWFASTEENLQHISALSIGEIQKGISKLPDSRRKDELQEWFDQLQLRYAPRILPFTHNTAKDWGKMVANLESTGRPLPVVDSLIAATAAEHGLSIVTRNTSDFVAAGVDVINIWR